MRVMFEFSSILKDGSDIPRFCNKLGAFTTCDAGNL